jgi:hypothetical protein
MHTNRTLLHPVSDLVYRINHQANNLNTGVRQHIINVGEFPGASLHIKAIQALLIKNTVCMQPMIEPEAFPVRRFGIRPSQSVTQS